MFSEHLLRARHGARHQADSSSIVVSPCVPHPCHPPALFTPSHDSEPTFTLKPAFLPWQLGEEGCGHSRKSTNICWSNKMERSPSLKHRTHRVRNIPWPPGEAGSQPHLPLGWNSFPDALRTRAPGGSVSSTLRVDWGPFQEGPPWSCLRPPSRKTCFLYFLARSCFQSEFCLSLWRCSLTETQDGKGRNAVH